MTHTLTLAAASAAVIAPPAIAEDVKSPAVATDAASMQMGASTLLAVEKAKVFLWQRYSAISDSSRALMTQNEAERRGWFEAEV